MDVSISGGKLRAKIRSVTKLKSMAADDEDDGPPQPDKESIRRDGEMVAWCVRVIHAMIEKEKKKKMISPNEVKASFVSLSLSFFRLLLLFCCCRSNVRKI